MEKCKFESENGECLINECMYEPITDKNKYNLCESVRKSLDKTTTDCEKCKVNKYCGTCITCEQAKEMYQQGRVDMLKEVLNVADCSHTDCWDCAFADVELCKLQGLYRTTKGEIG